MVNVFSVAILQRLYEFYRQKVTANRYYTYKGNVANDLIIKTFITVVNKQFDIRTLGFDFILGYLAWTFHLRTSQRKSTTFQYPINHIFGKKAFTDYNNQTMEIIDNYRQQFNRQYDIDERALIDSFKPKTNYSGIVLMEEIEKHKAQQLSAPIAYCADNTTLFNRKSEICFLCKDRRTCKILLYNNYPKIFKERGYAIND